MICTHPIQYYAPWFRRIASGGALHLRVFYLLQPDPGGIHDPFFGRQIAWDVPLLEGYDHEFVPNVSAHPGVGRFWGFRNPTLVERVAAFEPEAVLLIGYNFWSLMRFIFTWPRRRAPLIFRGDSHRLVPSTSLTTRLKDLAIRSIFKRFSAFLYVGEANRRYFELHGVEAGRLFHAPHAIDNERFQSRAATGAREAGEWRLGLGVPTGDTLVLFAGKLEPKKRPLDLVRAFLALAPERATLLIVGDGPLESELRRAAANSPKVRFAPFQNQSMMPLVYAASDLLVLPSHGAFETWGLAVNEAMAVGVPALVSNHVGCAQDLVEEGVTGWVFEAGDEHALRAALAKALANRGALRDRGLAARQRIARFDFDAAAKGLVRAVESLREAAA